LLTIVWLVAGLVGHDPWKSEEALHFGIILEMIEGQQWLMPHIAGQAVFDHPPLFHWLAATSAWLLSPLLPLHDGARIMSGLFMLGTFSIAALAARELYGKDRAVSAILLLMACLGLILRTHQIIPDTLALCATAITYFALALAVRQPLWAGLWLGIAWGLTLMSVGISETLTLVLISLLLPIFSRHWRHQSYGYTIAIGLLVCLPWLLWWPLLVYQANPTHLLAWLSYEWQSLAFTIQQWPSTWAFYLRTVTWYAFPVWPLTLWSLWRLYRLQQLQNANIVLPLLGAIVTLLTLSVHTQYRELYALPLLLPLMLLALPSIGNLRSGTANGWYWFSVMGFTFFMIVGWFYWSALDLGLPARLHRHLHTILPGYDFGWNIGRSLLAMCLSALWIGVLAIVARHPLRPLLIWTAGLTLTWALANTLFIGWVENAQSYRSMYSQMQRALPAQYRCLNTLDLGLPQQAMLHYFAQIRPVRVADSNTANTCDLLLTQGKPLDELLVLAPWQIIWEGNRPGDKKERYRLYHRP